MLTAIWHSLIKTIDRLLYVFLATEEGQATVNYIWSNSNTPTMASVSAIKVYVAQGTSILQVVALLLAQSHPAALTKAWVNAASE